MCGSGAHGQYDGDSPLLDHTSDMNISHKYLPLSAFCLLCGLLFAPQARSQSRTVTAEITLTSPSPSCSFTLGSNLDYGTAEKPGTGSASVSISATTGSRSVTGTTVSGQASVGQVRLTGSNVSSYTVSRTFPSTLTYSSSSLSFSGTWAHSTSSTNGYSAISASSYSGSAGGAGSSFTRYFRFGGEVSGINLSDGNGTYDGTISASATCN